MKENHALETWEEGAEAVVVGDPEIASQRSSSSSGSRSASHMSFNLMGLGAGTGAQRYAQLSYHEVCRENELLRRELESTRLNSRLILDVLEGAIGVPGASANHLALHSILGVTPTTTVPCSKEEAVDGTAQKKNSGSSSSSSDGSPPSTTETEGKMAHHKLQRQARQASIIIEELERTLSAVSPRSN